MPNGVAFRDGALYVAEVSRVLRYDAIEQRLDDPPAPVVVSASFPDRSHHGWKFIRFGPDGRLYVPVGAPCNACLEEDPRFASIMRMRPDGSGLEVFASGVRNTVGFDWDPATGALWFTDNGRDLLGDDVPDDELNRAAAPGLHFGFPFCHAGDVADPEFGGRRPCAEFVPPEAKLGAHVAALGMRFYDGAMFPADYRGSILIAEHGSWNRSPRSATGWSGSGWSAGAPRPRGLRGRVAAGRDRLGPARGRAGPAGRLAAGLGRPRRRRLPDHLRRSR